MGFPGRQASRADRVRGATLPAVMRLALLQLNPTVGAVEANAEALLRAAREAQGQGASLALAPELCLVGYPPRDLLERRELLRRVAAANARVVAEFPRGLTVVFGTLGGAEPGTALTGEEPAGVLLGNDALVARDGQVLARARKQLLPTYDVFDEARHFSPGGETARLLLDGLRVALTICEDAWAAASRATSRYLRDPLAGVGPENTDLVLNLSASPFTLPKLRERARVFSEDARAHGVPVAFVNQVGGNDELVFDGASAVYAADGSLVARAPLFEEAVLVVELDLDAARVRPRGASAAGPETTGSGSAPLSAAATPVRRASPAPLLSDEEAATRALVLGTRDYARKCGFSKAVLGLSGGIDSALVATLAADALGASNVLGVAMPTRYSSQGSLDDARALAKNLGLCFQEIDIDPLFAAYLQVLTPALDRAAPAPANESTFENLQARIRGATLMALSNRTGALLLTTGNKSEVSVGYCTLYGDMAGGLAVISDVPKTMVYRLAEWANRQAGAPRIPRSSIEKPPSAELRPNQRDDDSLPPYDILDRILELHVEQGLGARELTALGLDRPVVERVLRLVSANEYKRRQMPPGLIITQKAFGPGRRVPLAKGSLET